MTIQLKRSSTSGNIPASLLAGEIAINEADHQFFYRSPSGLITPFDGIAAMRYANLVINGAMLVDQERVGAALTGVTAVSRYHIDCFSFSATGTGAFTLQQVTDAPAGFTNSAKVSVTTAATSLAAGDKYTVAVPVEGYRVARLGWGAAGANSIAIGFWVKAHRTGTYSASIRNWSASRSYPFSFTISVADTWEYKTVVIPGDTTSTWANTNVQAWQLCVTLAAGTTWLGTAGAWVSSDFTGVTGTINGVAATTDTFQITGVSIIPGSSPIPSDLSRYMVREFAEEWNFCQRYYQKSWGYSEAVGTASFNGPIEYNLGSTTTSPLAFPFRFGPLMRATPTVTLYDTAGAVGKCYRGGAGKACGLQETSTNQGAVFGTSDTTANANVIFHWVADARM